MMNTGFITVMSVVVLIGPIAADLLPTCQPKDFHFEYTECDSYGGRWRVSVPQPGKCIGGAPNPPVRGKDCTFTCPRGYFLDVQGDQNCHACAAGTFSLGGGIRFESFDKIPKGFSVKTEGFSEGRAKSVNNCTKEQWQAKGNFLATLGSKCSSTLVYSATLARAGSVEFKYQYSDDATIFHFFIQNDKCQTKSDNEANVWPTMTEEGQWKTHRMDLKSGVNILHWKVIGIEMSDSASKTRKPVLIKEIEIDGVAFTSECTKCPGGHFSGKNSSECSPCPSNTYSSPGSAQCTACDAGEYSGPASEKCIKKPACTSQHYYDYMAPCNSQKMTQKLYQWIKPKYCDENLPAGVHLPLAGPLTPCPPCNPGMYSFNSSCVFCPKNTFSDGVKGICKPCPSTTAAVYGITYRWWNELPPNVTSSCMSFNDDGCATKEGWIPSGDHLQSGKGHMDDAYVVLTLGIGGFVGNNRSPGGKATELAKISFVVELDCTGKCALFFVATKGYTTPKQWDSAAHGASVIKAWYGKTPKVHFSYSITKNSPVTFSWAFQKMSWDDLENSSNQRSTLYTNDVAKIYSINVTNTLNGGASECMKCPEGTNSKGCIPCPDNHYIDRRTSKCMPCPENTIVHGDRPYGKESCLKCGEGLRADGGMCVSDCKFKSINGREYDFSALKGPRSVIGTKLFTSSGTQYFHVFKLSLCGKQLASCSNNFTSGEHAGGSRSKEHGGRLYHSFDTKTLPSSENSVLRVMALDNKEGIDKLHAFICRTTIIPPKNPVEPVLSAQPVSLGDHPVSVFGYTNSTTEELHHDLHKVGWISDEDDLDVHFKYVSETPTEACPKGRSVTIIMRCEVKEKGNGTIDLPPQCPDGTCDGCAFHFMWRSRYACPTCKDADYEEVKGECIKGEQIIHYYPPKHCVLSGTDTKPKKHILKCDNFPMWMKLSVLIACVTGFVLVVLLAYCWKRNKKLEYKYMKLVTSGPNKDGDAELPAAETCAIDEGEDDENFDSVQFSRESKGKKLFNKLKSMAGKRENFRAYYGDDNPFEHIKLTEKSPISS
ncbi:endosome/lysosome-associated apoptosis and autophagy regulator family member 2-like [Tubulanus polymorphus]|uniref:endosome/lysosome-associated apoptosis and autophagy regulator family member 2-like n=1 Tax=Tubulanus polymorphus TaxID=672921 RepID=UPI003DA42AE6